ncbi:MAG TPA: cytochrome c oxidase assembly protein [Ktedonobacteraceae bacterium]|jgi:putative membrane protein|nr:cytochrome c oxidase assembly protein [Ktedonobacteraceae bacterium]
MSIWVDANGWPIPPSVLLGCLVAELLYFRGWQALVSIHAQTANLARKQQSPGDQAEREEQAKKAASTPSESISVGSYRWDSWNWRAGYFLGAVFIALIGDSAPIDILSARYFWVHMIQHLLLLVVMAPLLVAAAPLQPLWLGLPGWGRRLLLALARPPLKRAALHVGHWLRQPVISCAILIAGTWIWHWPVLYDLALRNETIHDWCEHLTFLAVSVLFWTQIIPSPLLRPRLSYFGQLACLGVAIVQNVVLAMLLGFAQAPLYAPYAHLAAVSGGFPAILDQQLGAGIMWTFGDVPFIIAIAVLFQKWFALQFDDSKIAVHHDAGR